ncbi:hypothetical protein [Pseudomonas helleri]|uniref:hypothetical protein n=1 Tax=Pseudomonas helleri TaxID=1608996 RepID=UPI0024331E6A|nr:hypothetical protein [Pseudomonas helleri]
MMQAIVGVDIRDVIIEDMARTLRSLERTLRSAGSIEFQCYHNARDKELAAEFLKMADAAQASLDYKTQLQFFE